MDACVNPRLSICMGTKQMSASHQAQAMGRQTRNVRSIKQALTELTGVVALDEFLNLLLQS